MAQVRQDVILTFDADTGQVDKSVDILSSKLDRLTSAIEDMTDEFIDAGQAAKRAAEATDDIGEAAEDSGKALKEAGEKGATGFTRLKDALAATGLFALVVKVLQPIIQAFLENKRVADTLGQAFAAMGVVINDLVDFAVDLGTKLFETFSNPKQALLDLKDLIVENITNRIVGLIELLPALAEAFSLAFELKFAEAGKVATDAVAKVALGVEDYTDKVTAAASAVLEYANNTQEAVTAAIDLEKELQKLSDAERDLAVQTAQSRAQVEELKRQRDDQRLSIERRIVSAQSAAAIDQQIADENVRIAEQRAELLRREIEMQGETVERLQAVADAEIQAADARTTSLTLQTELQNSLFALNQELLDQNQQRVLAEQEALREKQQNLFKERGLVMEHNNILTGMEVDQETIRRNKMKEESDIRLATVAQERAAVVQLFDDSFQVINALQDAFGVEDEKRAKRNFKIQKALSLASATISAVEGTQNAFTTAQKSPLGIAFPGYAFVQAGLAAAFGAAKVAAIARSQFEAPGTVEEDTVIPSGGGFAGAAQPTTQAPTIDLGFLAQGSQSQVIETYVIADNVTTAQQANKKILEQSTL